MNNIHVLPTSQPSRFYFNNNDKCFQLCKVDKKSTPLKINQNIYITNDEEIKEGDWVLGDYPDNPICKVIAKYGQEFTAQSLNGDKYGLAEYDSKKIILTTDQDLIKDGVQAIDDEFLEWFVKNPSCEFVEIVEELKYFNLDELRERHLKGLPHIYSEKIGYKIIIPKEESKKETLEEIANKLSIKEAKDLDLFLKGIEWQKEKDRNKFSEEEVGKQKMYSEEEVLVKLYECLGHFAYQHNIVINGNEIDKWFEKFKKK
jgi:hypothetical protein